MTIQALVKRGVYLPEMPGTEAVVARAFDGNGDWERGGHSVALSRPARGTTLRKLRQGTKLSEQLLLMGVGWLAKEGKLTVVKNSRTLKVGLNGQ